MNTVFSQKWLWSLFQAVVVVSFVSVSLSGCGGSDSEEDEINGSGASLSKLTLSGTELDQAFQAELTTYTASVDSSQDAVTLTMVATNTEATIQVNGIGLVSHSAWLTIALDEGSNLIEIVVTAEDGASTTTYSLTVVRGSDTTALSSDASLAELFLDSAVLDQTFQAELTTYTASVDSTQDAITLTVVAADSNATIQVDGAKLDQINPSLTLALEKGSNTFEIVVTAEDGASTLIYTLDVFRSSGSDAEITAVSLVGLTLAEAELDQPFQPDRMIYTASVELTQESISLRAVTAVIGSTIHVKGVEMASGEASEAIALSEGSNLIEILVTSEDGRVTATYTLGVFRGIVIATESTIASLSELILTGASLDQLFQPEQMSYTASVNFLQHSVTLTPVASDDGATIRVNGAEVASGSASESVALYEGQNIINLEVTAEDGETTQNYSITLLREYAALFAQQAYLKARIAGEDDQFSYDSIAISGDTLVVGARYEDSSASAGEGDNSASAAGAVYVFSRSGGVWSQQAYLKASNAETEDNFGASVAISGDTLVVGAIGEDSSASGGEEDNTASAAGAAYVFSRSGGVWNQQAYLKASNAEAGDRFGWSVAISDDTLVVGARYEDSSASGGEGDNSASAAGAAYVFSRSGGVWSQQAYLKANNAEAEDYFGAGVAISGDTLVVGADDEDGNAIDGEGDNTASAAGAAYVFSRSGGVWNQQAYLKASNAEGGDRFGWSVAISGETLVVGSHFEAGNLSGGEQDNSAPGAGAAYVFTRNNGVWHQQAYLKASNAEAYDYFGRSVAISGDTLVVGAYREDGSATGGEDDNLAENAGAAYLFTRSNDVWSQQAYLKASNAEAEDYFGASVAISGDTLIIGAPNEDSRTGSSEADNSATWAGAAYVWQ